MAVALLPGHPAQAAPTTTTSAPAVTTTTGASTSTAAPTTTTTAPTLAEPTTDQQTVFLATGLDFADALAAASTRSGSSTNVLLTQKDTVPATTIDAILRLNPQEIVVVGGTDAVSESVMKQVESLNIGRVVRVGGKDRYETAALLSQLALPGVDDFAWWVHWLLLALVVIYGASLYLLGRRGYLWTSDRVVHATIAGLKARVGAYRETLETRQTPLTPDEGGGLDQVKKVIGILDEAAASVKVLPSPKQDTLGAWRQLHEADVQWIRAAPPEEVRARFPVVAAEVRAHKPAVAAVMAGIDPRNAEVWELRETLAPALSAYYMDRDNFFESLSRGADQAQMLTYIGLAVIVVVGLAFGRQPLLLLGAVGGLSSRLIGAVKQPPTKTDYGASWSRTFISPVVGALGGWAGTPVIHLLTVDPLKVLNPNLGAGWDHPFQVVSLGVAFVLGFSERLLPAVIGTAASALAGSKSDSGATTPSDGGSGSSTPSPSTAIPGGGGRGQIVVASTGAADAKSRPPLRLTQVIPDVAGFEPLKAVAWLEDLHLVVTLADPEHSSQPAGQVTGTDPPAGKVVRTGSPVTVKQSSGPAPPPDPTQGSG